MKSKVHEVNKHISDNSVDIFCLAKLFLGEMINPETFIAILSGLESVEHNLRVKGVLVFV
jgi:hypothetical protein